MDIRKKDVALLIRVTSRDRDLVREMARKAGQTVSDFVMSRVWGEVGNTHTEVSTEAQAPFSLAPDALKSEKLGALLSIPGVRLGSQAFGEEAKPVALRRFNASRPGWYDILRRSEYGEVLQDNQDHRIWMHQAGKVDAILCASRVEADRLLDQFE